VGVKARLRFRELAGATYLPILSRATLYRFFLSGKVEQIPLCSGHQRCWWSYTSFLTIGVLPSFHLFIHLPESNLAITIDPCNTVETNLPNLLEERMMPGICVTSRCIYLFGGSECDVGFFNPMSTCEKLDLEGSTWVKIPDLRYPRSSSGALLKGRIYLASPDMLEVLDTHSDQYLSPIPIPGLQEREVLSWRGSLLLPHKEYLLISGFQKGITVTSVPGIESNSAFIACIALEGILEFAADRSGKNEKVRKILQGNDGFHAKELASWSIPMGINYSSKAIDFT
jgi:hypothetical protein